MGKTMCCYECPVQLFCAGYKWDGCSPFTCGHSRKIKSARKYDQRYIAVAMALEGRTKEKEYECLTCSKNCTAHHTYRCKHWKPTLKVSKRTRKAAAARRRNRI
jgi:hypothetical protein